jgi:hypothetical protein
MFEDNQSVVGNVDDEPGLYGVPRGMAWRLAEKWREVL